jgi:hypothetical protein
MCTVGKFLLSIVFTCVIAISVEGATTTVEQIMCLNRCTAALDSCTTAATNNPTLITFAQCISAQTHCNSECKSIDHDTRSPRVIALSHDFRQAFSQHVLITREFAIAFLGAKALQLANDPGIPTLLSNALLVDSTQVIANTFFTDNIPTIAGLVAPFVNKNSPYTGVPTPPSIPTLYSNNGKYPDATGFYPNGPTIGYVTYPYGTHSNGDQAINLLGDHVKVVVSLLQAIAASHFNLSDPSVGAWISEWNNQGAWIIEYVVHQARSSEKEIVRQSVTACVEYHLVQTVQEVVNFIYGILPKPPATVITPGDSLTSLTASATNLNNLLLDANNCGNEAHKMHNSL